MALYLIKLKVSYNSTNKVLMYVNNSKYLKVRTCCKFLKIGGKLFNEAREYLKSIVRK